MVCDVTNDEMVEKVVQDILQLFHRIDVVIANAGYGQSGWVQKVEMHQWRRQSDVISLPIRLSGIRCRI